MKRFALALFLLAAALPVAAQEPSLSIIHYGPTGELATLDQVKEIRVVFSQPVVRLGRIPQPVTAPFFSISPPSPAPSAGRAPRPSSSLPIRRSSSLTRRSSR